MKFYINIKEMFNVSLSHIHHNFLLFYRVTQAAPCKWRARTVATFWRESSAGASAARRPTCPASAPGYQSSSRGSCRLSLSPGHLMVQDTFRSWLLVELHDEQLQHLPKSLNTSDITRLCRSGNKMSACFINIFTAHLNFVILRIQK